MLTPLDKPLSTFFLSSKFAGNDYVAVETTNEIIEILENEKLRLRCISKSCKSYEIEEFGGSEVIDQQNSKAGG